MRAVRAIVLLCLACKVVLARQPLLALSPPPQPQCGTWMSNYTVLHKAIIQKQRPQRLLVSVPVNSGFADRMIGSITAMLFALLTDRAVVYDTCTANGGPSSRLRPLSDVFDTKTVDWSGHESPKEVIAFLNDVSPTNEDADAIQKFAYGPVPLNNVNSSYYISMVNGWGSDSLFTDIMDESAPFEIVYLVLNRGMTVSAFNSPVARQRLESMGLNERLTFACLYRFLFQPNAGVFSMFPTEISVLTDQHALKVGLQIRTGDLANLVELTNRTSIDLFKAFFDCAQEVEDTRKLAGQRVVWYFMSDSVSLRRAVAAQFGGKVLTKTSGIDTSHSAKETARQGQGPVSLMTYRSIAGEHWLFSMTDFQVISFDSGIGRSAAFLGHHPMDTVYTINKWWDSDPPTMGQPRKCGVQDADDYRKVAATWSLI